jgi:cytoskeletal protein RodZ
MESAESVPSGKSSVSKGVLAFLIIVLLICIVVIAIAVNSLKNSSPPQTPSPSSPQVQDPPKVMTVKLTKDSSNSVKPVMDNNEGWKTFQIGEIKLYNADGNILGYNDYSSVKYTAAGNGQFTDVFPAINAVDGDIGTFTHTAAGSENIHQLTLVLKTPQVIKKVEVYNRKDCCQSRLYGTVLLLESTDGSKVASKILNSDVMQTLVL